MLPTFDDVVRFHGHMCPGLAIGYRMACAAMLVLNAAHSDDEAIVAIVENNACGVDALQCVTGCTFGKGNLIFRDYGKHVYTLYSRTTSRGVRVAFHGRGIPEGLREDKAAFAQWVLEAPVDALLSLEESWCMSRSLPSCTALLPAPSAGKWSWRPGSNRWQAKLSVSPALSSTVLPDTKFSACGMRTTQACKILQPFR